MSAPGKRYRRPLVASKAPATPNGGRISTTQAVRLACRSTKKVTDHSEPAVKDRGVALVHSSLHGVLDVFVLFDLDVFDVSGDLLDFANVDRVDDVAGVWIDGDLAARALPT
jgi:hypothetical protein